MCKDPVKPPQTPQAKAQAFKEATQPIVANIHSCSAGLLELVQRIIRLEVTGVNQSALMELKSFREKFSGANLDEALDTLQKFLVEHAKGVIAEFDQ